MLDLENLKIVAFCFDDTLFAHSKHKTESSEEEIRFLINCLSSSDGSVSREKNWASCSINQTIRGFMKYCSEKGIRMGLISASVASVCTTEKVKYTKEKYGYELCNWCVGTSDTKLKMLTALSKAYRTSKGQILIVDDNLRIVQNAEDNGFQSATPLELINIFANQ